MDSLAPIEYLDTNTFDKLTNRAWRSFQAEDVERVPWFNNLADNLHKFVLISSQNLPSDGKEATEEFVTQNLLVVPEKRSANHEKLPGRSLCLLCCSKDMKDCIILSDLIEHAQGWIREMQDSFGFDVFLAVHKGKLDADEGFVK